MESKVITKSLFFMCVCVFITLFVLINYLVSINYSNVHMSMFVWVKFKHPIVTPLFYNGYIVLKYTVVKILLKHTVVNGHPYPLWV